MLGAVEAQCAPPQDRRHEEHRERGARDRRPRPVDEPEPERRDQCDQDQPPLTPLRDPVTLEERSQRRIEPHEPAGKRDALQQLGRLRHRALAQGAVDAREGPVALAHDHDAVGARHAAEAGELRGGVG